MSEHIIMPFQGVDDIRFGMSHREVHAILGNPPTDSDGFQGEETTREVYEEMVVDYSPHGRCDFIHVIPPGVAVFKGMRIGGDFFREIVQELVTLDNDLCVDYDGCTSLELGIGLYLEDACSPDAMIEGIAVFPKGHYRFMEDEMRNRARWYRPMAAPAISGEPIQLEAVLADLLEDKKVNSDRTLHLDISRPIVCGGILLTGQPYWSVSSHISELDVNAEFSTRGLMSQNLGLAIYSRGALLPSACVNGVVAVREDGWGEAKDMIERLFESA